MDDPFLNAIESCAQPPPQKRLFEDRIAEFVTAPVPQPPVAVHSDLVRRINDINIGKQQKMTNKSDVIVPAGGMVALARGQGMTTKTESISRNEVQDWKAQVLATNRPRNQWNGLTTAEAELEESRQYARSIAAMHGSRIEIRTEGTESARSFSGSEEEPFPSPPVSAQRRYIGAGSTAALKPESRTNVPESDKYSDYSSASSNKSPSPPQTSPNPSDYSVTSSQYHRPTDIYRTAPAEVYRNPHQPEPAKKAPPPVAKKTVTIVPGVNRVVPLAASTTWASTSRPLPSHVSLRSQTRKALNFNPHRLPVDTSSYAWSSGTGSATAPELRGVARVVEEPEQKKERHQERGPPQHDSAVSSRQPSENSSSLSVEEARRRRWRELAEAADEADRFLSEKRVGGHDEHDGGRRHSAEPTARRGDEEYGRRSAASSEHRGRESVTERMPLREEPQYGSHHAVGWRTVEEDYGRRTAPAASPSLNTATPATVVGDCSGCSRHIHSSDELKMLDGRGYHAECFICSVCKRNLRDCRYYSAKGRLYCEADYRYTGAAETSEKCAKCGHPIVDMVLQALGRYFHPACFRCTKCRSCLDGIPFALDTKGDVYCMRDYHALFAPRCAACTGAILPDPNTGETVRVVAINNDYHVECYVCEGCKVRLTDESNSRCYPLGSHLLCYDCHLLWRRTGGEAQPITDL